MPSEPLCPLCPHCQLLDRMQSSKKLMEALAKPMREIEVAMGLHAHMKKPDQMPVYYVAHPVRGDVPKNLARARRWVRWLCEEFPSSTFIAPWIVECEIYRDDVPRERAAGIIRSCATVSRCDGLIHVGGIVSEGMFTEAGVAPHVYDLTPLGPEPPEVGSHGWVTTQELGLIAATLARVRPATENERG